MTGIASRPLRRASAWIPGAARTTGVAALLDWAADQLAKVRWDLELHASHSAPRADSAVAFADIDPLARLEITRVGIGHVLAGLFDELADTTNWEG